MADFIDISPISLNEITFSDASLPSSNFGGGIELLMNDTIFGDSSTSTSPLQSGRKNKLDDISKLEMELNDLVKLDDPSSSSSSSSSSFRIEPESLFTDEKIVDNQSSSSSFSSSSGLGSATLNDFGTKKSGNKTWDGYSKFNNIPINPDKQPPQLPASLTNNDTGLPLTKEEILREKFKYLRNLDGLETKGVTLTKKYSMESSLAEMQGEYDLIMEEKAKQNSVKFQGNMLMAMINGIEFLNNKFDPFDVKLDGWSEQLNENMTDYDDVFGELYEKYKSRATLAPELKLLFQLGGSAIMVHMTNTMFKSSMPNMDDILRQNPDLMRQFQSAAVNAMGDTNPGFANFVNNVAPPSSYNNNNNNNNNHQGPPPPPMATQGPSSIPPPRNRNGNNDSMFFDMKRGNNNNNNNGKLRTTSSSSRAEMVGPSDLNDILSGIKMKNNNNNNNNVTKLNSNSFFDVENQNNITMQTNSVISVSDLKDMTDTTAGLSDQNQPLRSRRKPKSDRVPNTMSLNI